MSLLSDNDALRTKRWLEDVENDFASPELINPYMRSVIDYKRQRLNEYEEDAALNDRPTFVPDPKKTTQNIPYYQGALTEGGEQYFGKNFSLYDTQERRADIIAPRYISDMSGLSKSEIKERLPSYKQYYMNKHGVNNFATALQMDMEETNEKSNLISEIYDHAQLSSAKAASDIEFDRFKAMSEFIDSKDDDFSMSTEMSDIYRDSYLKNLEIYKTNQQSFDKLSDTLSVATEETFGSTNIFKAALALNEIDPKYRKHALRYAEQQIPGGAEGIKTFLSIATEAFRERTGSDYMDVVQDIREMAKQMAEGGEVEVARGRTLSQGNAFDALMNVSMAERADWVQFFTRIATEDEKDILWRDMQSAGEYAASIDAIEEFVRGKTTDVSGLDSALQRHLYDKMLFPTLESLPYMVEYGSYAIGGFGVGLGVKAIGVGSKVVRGGVSTALIVNGTERAYARNHFKELVREFPEMDKGLALSVAQWQGRSEAVVAAFGNILQLKMLPQPIRKIFTGNIAGEILKGTWKGAALRTLGMTGVEMAEEVMQDVSAGLTRNIYSAFFNEDVPIREHLAPTWEEIGDIFWAVLPMSMLGGVSGKFLKPDVKTRLLSDRNRLMKTFGDEEVVNEILDAETVSEKEAIYKANYSAQKHAELIREAVEDGATTSDFVSEEAVAAAKEADAIEADPELREPQVIPVDLEPGQTEQKYAVVYEDGRREVHDSFSSAVERLVDYKETGEVQAELDTKKLLDLDTEKAQVEQEIADLEKRKAQPKKNRVTEKEFTESMSKGRAELKGLDAGFGEIAYNYTTKEGVEVTIREGVAFDIDGNQVASDIELDLISSKERGKGHASRELDKILEEADRRDMSVSLNVSPSQAILEGEEIGLTTKQLVDWYEKRGFIFEGKRGYRPRKSESGKRIKAGEYIAKEGEIVPSEIIDHSDKGSMLAVEKAGDLEVGFHEAGERLWHYDGKTLKRVANVDISYDFEEGVYVVSMKPNELAQPTPEAKPAEDFDAQIEAKRKRLADIEKESKALKAKPKPEPKEEKPKPKDKDKDLEDHAKKNGNTTTEDTDEKGKPTKVVDKKPKQSSETGENINAEELQIDHKFVEEYMPKLAEKLLSEKEASVWKAEMLDIITSPNWISSAQSRLRVLLGEISDKGRPEQVRYNDQQLLMLYQRHLMQERASANAELAKALAENNEGEVKRIRELLISREKEINDITAVLYKVGSFAGKVLVQRQASLDFEEVGAAESVKRKYRTIVGKEPTSAMDKQIERKADELKELHKKRIEILQKAAKLHSENVVDGASETVNQSKADAKKENLSKEEAIKRKNELLRKVLKAADKHNWCIGG